MEPISADEAHHLNISLLFCYKTQELLLELAKTAFTEMVRESHQFMWESLGLYAVIHRRKYVLINTY